MFGKKKNEDYSVKTVKVGVDKLTTIALGTMVKGTITVEGDLRLDGIIEGNVSCRGKVPAGKGRGPWKESGLESKEGRCREEGRHTG